MAIEPAYYCSLNPGMTQELGRRLGLRLKSGDVVALFGEVGAGKTAFIRGLAAGMGITDSVTSPTYTIVNEYEGPIPMFHFDMYRLGSAQEVFDIGWEDYLGRGGVCAVEWSSHILPALENGYIRVDIRSGFEDPARREITISRAI